MTGSTRGIGGDEFRPDGRADALFTMPWWRCGKWCKIMVETADEPMTIGQVEFAETRSPLNLEAKFECDDPFVAAILLLCARSLEVCMHETFFDCPHYEQQMYPGDGRFHFQAAGLFDLEDRLVRNALTLYDFDRRDSGMISVNCPTRGTQDGFGFAGCEIFMFRDCMMSLANRKWFEMRLPGMNHTLMGFAAFEREDGLPAIDRGTISYKHCLFETFFRFGRGRQRGVCPLRFRIRESPSAVS